MNPELLIPGWLFVPLCWASVSAAAISMVAILTIWVHELRSGKVW